VRQLGLGHDPGTDRAEGVDRLGEGEHAGLHLPALDVAGRDVVEDRVPGDVVLGLIGPEEPARRSPRCTGRCGRSPRMRAPSSRTTASTPNTAEEPTTSRKASASLLAPATTKPRC